VDDHETNRRILVEWLKSWRMQPTAVGDGVAAHVALTQSHDAGAPFALVLLDARMPDTDGLTLAGEIQRRWDAAAPRLILLSSDDNPVLAARSRENGVLAYLLKPVQQSELLEAIWAAMNLDLAPAIASAHSEDQTNPSQPLRILVAEDNELNVALLQELLRRRGHQAQFAGDGRTALDLALLGTFDLMLLDLHMPELDGFEVVRAVREREERTDRHLPIIALTARDVVKRLAPVEATYVIVASSVAIILAVITPAHYWGQTRLLLTCMLAFFGLGILARKYVYLFIPWCILSLAFYWHVDVCDYITQGNHGACPSLGHTELVIPLEP